MSKSSTTTNGPVNRLPPVHPGEVLREELKERGLTASALSRALDVPVTRVTDVLNGRRGVTADTALRLARFFGGSPQFWLNLQQSHDLKVAEAKAGDVIRKRVRPAA
ncbi:MAG: addiction module antidote protein, HigA family [Rhodospirillaceae bacterium]|nr:MAG: addiction module antidote protein, HigA family [Rhodospirillaceae bacterium]